MTTFNKILNPMYSVIAAYSKQEDGSINAKYVLGTGTDNDGAVTDFTPVSYTHLTKKSVIKRYMIIGLMVKQSVKLR